MSNKLTFFPALGEQYTPYPLNGKSVWSTLPSDNKVTVDNIKFKPIIVVENLSLPPCIILDNFNNLYVTLDGYPNKLLKYKEQNGVYTNIEFVSDEAWLWGDNMDLPTTPVAMAFSEDFNYMYVVNFTHNSITVITMATFEYQYLNITDYISFKVGFRFNEPNGLTFSSNFEYMVVTNIKDSNLVKITLTDPFTAKISPFNKDVPFTQPILITVDDKNNFYVSDLTSSQIIVVTGENNSEYKIIASSPYIKEPRGVSFNSENFNKLWVTNILNTNIPILGFNVNGKNVVTNRLSNNLFDNPRGIIFDKYNYMYISNFGDIDNKGSILKSLFPVYNLIY
jgi:DNA-binding beta-propeller fold protein YncE